jgi:hypothetical protein
MICRCALYQTAQVRPELITALISQSRTCSTGQRGLRIEAMLAYPPALAAAKCRASMVDATCKYLLMLTRLHGLDVMSPLKKKLPSEERLDEETSVLSQLAALRLRKRNLARHRAERARSGGCALSRLPVVPCLALRKNAPRARNENHGKSIIRVDRRAFRQARSVAPPAASPSQYRGISIPSSQGKLT